MTFTDTCVLESCNTVLWSTCMYFQAPTPIQCSYMPTIHGIEVQFIEPTMAVHFQNTVLLCLTYRAICNRVLCYL